jgi:hypothetical protein
MCRDSRMYPPWLPGGIAAVFLVVGVPSVLAGPLAYLSNLDEASVTVVDTTSLTETVTIALPECRPRSWPAQAGRACTSPT